MTMPVNSCVPGPELIGHIADLARLEWTPGATAAAAKRFGWVPDGSRTSSYATNTGHHVLPEWFGGPDDADTECMIPFCYYYEPDDFDAELQADGLSGNVEWLAGYHSGDPGWIFDREAGRSGFDGRWRAAVDAFGERLGEPETVVRDEKGDRPWNYAAWRCGGNAVVVGQCVDNGSYMTFEQALIWVGPHPADEPFPTGEQFALRLEC
ncbi:hypothetical protein D3C57_107170 [Streptomyces rapamycinicus NRRL 5491]|uniref:Uncharacterized protein n=2 Tax=Streptomyces rapamycinicus TaxID=1226757 RepID=A0A3L8REW6_STRRN|nr:hypothetical protein D3C57_107170 [Streptomyces rapamycinicus NRRL 5491]